MYITVCDIHYLQFKIFTSEYGDSNISLDVNVYIGIATGNDVDGENINILREPQQCSKEMFEMLKEVNFKMDRLHILMRNLQQKIKYSDMN